MDLVEQARMRTASAPKFGNARNPPIINLMAKEYVEERNGGYYLAGTRISLDSIVQCFNEGLSPEAILAEFETLTLAQVFGAITFYLENQPAIDAYRLRQEQRFEATRRASAPLPAGLRERIEAAREHLHSGRPE
jgi:uncharacterized protein (DUF433 family)